MFKLALYFHKSKSKSKIKVPIIRTRNQSLQSTLKDKEIITKKSEKTSSEL